jgi:hypothetical protein
MSGFGGTPTAGGPPENCLTLVSGSTGGGLEREPTPMARYVVEWNDRCAACGGHAAVVYEQERHDGGVGRHGVRRHVECRNPRCPTLGGGVTN